MRLLATPLQWLETTPVPSRRWRPAGETIGIRWALACHILLVIGETLVAPLGMAQVLKLAPPKLLGVVMGVWFVSGAAGYWLAGEIGALWFTLSPTVGLTLLTLLPLFGAYVVRRQPKEPRRNEPSPRQEMDDAEVESSGAKRTEER